MTEMQLLEVLKLYHTGQEKAVSSRELEAAFQIDGPMVRRLINGLRCDGYPVCSDQNGYFYASSSSELLTTIRQLSSRISKISRAKSGLVRASTCCPDYDQTTLPI